MALDEVSFYNLVGDEVSPLNLLMQMIDLYEQKREVGETKLTDFNEGSVIRNIIEGCCVLAYAVLEDETEASKLPFISSSYGTWLDKIGENPFINLPRVEGNPSQGIATFTLSFEQENDFLIPLDTLLEDDNELQYVTTSDCTIYAGELTAEVSCECLTDGYEGNIQPGQLTKIVDDSIDSDLVSVNNLTEFSEGTDLEDDEDYRTRLLENVRADGFGSEGYYLALGNNVPGVHDVKLADLDDSYTSTVVVNGYDKLVSDSVLLDVLTEFSDVNNLIYKQVFNVAKPTYVDLDLTFDLTMLQEWSDDDLTMFVSKIVNGGSYEQMEFVGLNIGDNLTRDLIIGNFELLGDVVDIKVYVTGESSEFTSTDLSELEVVKLGTLTFNQTIVE
ncbi:MAG: baseplate J/gp47 family protein [Bacilli bacterium]|nr:baseplate J/gp47 family protein [Bacilli bacterium]